MVISYASIICQLNGLNMQRRQLTNANSFYKRQLRAHTVQEDQGRKKEEKEKELIQDTFVDGSYSNISEKAEKQIYETLNSKLEKEVNKKSVSRAKVFARGTSLKMPKKTNYTGRRHSEEVGSATATSITKSCIEPIRRAS